MTTTDSSFVANGPAAIGVDARTLSRRLPFKLGALAVGNYAGVYGATNDGVLLPPAARLWANAGVLGSSNHSNGIAGSSETHYGVMGQSGTPPTSPLTSQPPLPSTGSGPGPLPAAAGVHGLSQNAVGVFGLSDNEAGVVGATASGHGVIGSSFIGPGVWGSSWSGTGVNGESSTGAGARGGSTWGYGVSGESTSNNGVYGVSYEADGIKGLSVSSSGILGIAGADGPPIPNPVDIAGVVGKSDARHGVIGTSNALVGVYGFSANSIGILGRTGNPASQAGYFAGDVTITGNLTLNGMKSAAVPFPDGSRRLLYCMESPELWFEDFGTGKLKGGRTVVKLDADFAKVIKPGYKVFLTPEGDCRGLFVRRKRATSFEVRELMGGKSAIAFSYRIVGRRKDIKEHRRFAKVDTRLRLPVPRARPARTARRAKVPPPTPAGLRNLATRREKQAEAQMSKRARKRKRSAR